MMGRSAVVGEDGVTTGDKSHGGKWGNGSLSKYFVSQNQDVESQVI